MAKKRKSSGAPRQVSGGLKKMIRMVVSEELDKRMHPERPFSSPYFEADHEVRMKEPDSPATFFNEWVEDWFAPQEPEAEVRPNKPNPPRRGVKKNPESPAWMEMEQERTERWESPASARKIKKQEPSRRERGSYEAWHDLFDQTASVRSVRSKKRGSRGR